MVFIFAPNVPVIVIWIRIVYVYIFFWIDFSRLSFEEILGLLIASTVIAYPVIVNISEQLFNNKKNDQYCRIDFYNTLEERIIEYLKNTNTPKSLKEIVTDIGVSDTKLRNVLYVLANIGVLCRLGCNGTNLKFTHYIGKGNFNCPLKDACTQCSY